MSHTVTSTQHIIRVAEPNEPVRFIKAMNPNTLECTLTPDRAQAQRFATFLDAEELVDAAFDHPTPTWVSILLDVVPCARCGGTGMLTKQYVCPRCEGRGRE